MFLIILGALVAFTVVILLVANVVTASSDEARGEDPRLRAAVIERIAPIGRVNIAPVVTETAPPAVAESDAPAPATGSAPAPAPASEAAQASKPAPAATTQAMAAPARSGEQVSNAACNACHLLGVLEAPKIGDADAWRPRLAAAGLDGLVLSAINGKGNMPARGGANVTDAEIRAAVEHMLTVSGVEIDSATAEGGASAAAPAPAPVTAQSALASAAGAETAPVETVAAAAPAAAVDLAQGKTIYDTACFACHLSGAAGAPKLGDQALWAPRIAKGMETLTHNAINGIGAMPAKGGRVDIADADIASAVAYMIEQSR